MVGVGAAKMHPKNMLRHEPVHIQDDDEFILPQTPQEVLTLLDDEDWRWMVDPYDEQEILTQVSVSRDYVRVVTVMYDCMYLKHYCKHIYVIERNGTYTHNRRYIKADKIESRPTKIKLI